MVLKKGQLRQAGADEEMVERIASILSRPKTSEREIWEQLTKEVLHPDTPSNLLQLLHQWVFKYNETSGDAPMAWWPSQSTIDNSNIGSLCRELGVDYAGLHKWSVTKKTEFWDTLIREVAISFMKPYSAVADFSRGVESPDWLVNAVFNIADSCFDKADPEQLAIILQPEGGAIETWTYGQLKEMACRVANGLVELGLGKGDAVAIDMPMTAEAVAAYLGIIKMGGVVVSIADSLAAAEVDKRLHIANAKAIFTQDVMIRAGKTLPLYEKFDKDSLPPAIVIPAGKTLQLKIREVDMPWDDFLSDVSEFDSVELHAADHCNILFSSGTTGDPKAIPWTHTTPIKCAADGYLHHNIQQGDVVAWPTNIGWMMGPWLIFASLINNATIALYYGAPAGRDFGEFVQNARVNMLGLVPSMVKRWIETDCMKGLNWSSIKVYSSTGESSNPQDYLWLMCRAGWKPVIEYCGGTEIGGGYFTGTVVQPASPSAFSTTALGLDVLIMDEEEEPGSTGELYVLPPSIGLSTSLLNKDHHEVYYANTPKPNPAVRGSMGTTLKDQFAEFRCSPVLRRHGDEVQQLPNGYFKALGRVDDTMNLGGIKTSSVEIERILDLVDGVAETAAISINPKGGGPEELIVFAVLHEGHDMGPEELKSVFQASIRKNLNPLFHIRDVVVTETLPRTASNKVMRRVLRKRYTKSHPD